MLLKCIHIFRLCGPWYQRGRASAHLPPVCVCVLIISISRSTFRGRPRRICGTEAVFYSLLVRETERRSLSAGVVVFANVFGTFRKAVIVGRHPPIHPHVCPKTRRNHHHCRSSFFRVSQTQARARAPMFHKRASLRSHCLFLSVVAGRIKTLI